MPPSALKPHDKKAFIGEVGRELVQRHGKQKYYKTDDVGRAVAAKGYPVDWACWAYSIFSSAEAFNSLHAATGEVCDYATMKAEVLRDLAGGSFEWPDIDLSWLEWPDIDFPDIFNW